MRAATYPVLAFGFSVKPGPGRVVSLELPAATERWEQSAGSGFQPQCTSYPCYFWRAGSFPNELPRGEPVFQKASWQPSLAAPAPFPSPRVVVLSTPPLLLT